MNLLSRQLRSKLAHPWCLASYLGLVALLVLAPWLALDSGYSYDEALHYEYGDLVLAWYRSGFTDQRALDFGNLYLYGGLFDLFAQWLVSAKLLPIGGYETRHIVTAFVGVLGVVATWKTAARIAGPRAGWLAAAILVATPAWLGHSLFNPKDIPFGCAAAFVAYASVLIATTDAPLRWGDALRAMIAYGIALGVRPGGMFLGGFILLAASGRVAMDALRQPIKQTARHALFALGKLACLLPLSWSLMLSGWPWAQLDPLHRPFEAATIAAHFGWEGNMLFKGQIIHSDAIPLDYLPVWFVVTLPELFWFSMLASLAAAVLALVRRTFSRRRMLSLLCLAAFVAVPLAGVLIKQPVIYDAQRHFLFILPPLAAMCGVALSDCFADQQLPRLLRASGAAVWLSLLALVMFDMASLHPYEYVYFNRIYGGLPQAKGHFETDYWGASFREGFDWVVKNVQPKSHKPIRVAACDDSPGRWQLEYMREHWNVEDNYVLVDESPRSRGRIYLGYTRNNCHKRRGKVLHVVEREGVPLLYVLRQ